MPTQHSTITGSDLHEPKGIASAAAEKVYIANGSGSGAFGFIDPKGASTAAAGKVYSANGSGSGTFEYPTGKLFAELHITGSSTSQTLAGSSAFAKLDPGSAWTQGQVKNYPAIFGSYFGTHSVNSLSQGYPVPEQPVYLHSVCQAPRLIGLGSVGSNEERRSKSVTPS